MQCGVHSHVRESTVPVQRQFDGAADGRYCIAGLNDMDDAVRTILRTDNNDFLLVPGCGSGIAWLAATEWIKNSLINAESLFTGRCNDTSTGLQIGIFSK